MIKLFLRIFFISVTVTLPFSCKKSNSIIDDKKSDSVSNEAEISYWYNGAKVNHYDLNETCIIKGPTYYNDTAYYYYTAFFPFSSEKTTGGISFHLYNDTLYPGQMFKVGNWNGPYEQYWLTRFTSNDLAALVMRPGGNRYDQMYFHADKSFAFSIDTIRDGKASGRFEGNMIFYTDGLRADSISLEQGLFRNIPIVNL